MSHPRRTPREALRRLAAWRTELTVGVRPARLRTAAALFALAAALNLTALDWGLPSAERSRFYPADPSWYEARQDGQRLYQTAPYESFHPDEGGILNALGNMDPGRLDFNPNFFNYPTLWIYATGAALSVADLFGFVHIETSKAFYVSHPEEMARIYLTGRLLAAFSSTLGVVLLYITTCWLFGAGTGTLAGLSLALSALWARDSHFLLVNVPSAALMTATALLATVAIRRESVRWLLGSALVAGLAASVKYPAGAIFVLSIFAYVAIRERTPRRLWVLLPLVALAGFLVGTPSALVAPGEVLRDLGWEGRDKLGALQGIVLVKNLVTAMGTSLSLAVIAGLGIMLTRLHAWPYRFVLLWLIAGLGHRLLSDADYVRYLIPALPPLAIAAGIALEAAQRALTPRHARLAIVPAALVLTFSLGYTLETLDRMRGRDVRERAASWIAATLRPGETIGHFGALWYDAVPVNREMFTTVDLTRRVPDHVRIILVPSTQELLVAKWMAMSALSKQHFTVVQRFDQRQHRIWTYPFEPRSRDWAYTALNVSILEPQPRPTVDHR